MKHYKPLGEGKLSEAISLFALYPKKSGNQHLKNCDIFLLIPLRKKNSLTQFSTFGASSTKYFFAVIIKSSYEP